MASALTNRNTETGQRAICCLVISTLLLMVPLPGFVEACPPNPDLTALAWNTGNSNLPLLSLPERLPASLSEFPAYPAREFALPVSQPLSYSSDCDCYSLTVVPNSGNSLRVLQLWRAPAGFYRTQSGPYLELEDSGSLVAITALDGTRFLFADVGRGERRCVSIHTRSGDYLLIDYTAAGLISGLRDAALRTIVPGYDNGRIISLTQTWQDHQTARVRTTRVRL